jgi:alkanesulfonate monooxygenase SsuD/methylene tetrahydromethanopterin reductase-like flavin-dependent oxidoreductase (luciferase family)
MLDLPLAIAIIGGQLEHFTPLVRLYREAASRAGHDPARLPVSINSHTYVAETSQQASDEYYPTYAAMMNRIGRERSWSPMGRNQFEMGRSPRGALLVDSPEEVIQKILFEYELFGHKRFMAQIRVGTLPHEKVMRAIELFATVVAPAVRKEIERRSTSSAGGPSAS